MHKRISSSVVNTVTNKMMKRDMQLYALKKNVDAVDVQEDISYADHLEMDYYVPIDAEQTDNIFIVDIHGGAWIYGDKKLNKHFCMHLSSYGFPVFNINYELVPTATVQKQIQQIFLALHYIIEHAEHFHIQGYKLCLCGDSAGAHLASLVACICRDSKLQECYKVNCEGICVDALLLQHGIYDLELMKETLGIYSRKLYSWMFPRKDVKLRDKDSICRFLDSSWNIPMFLLSSENDKMFSPQTLTLAKRLQQLNIDHELLFWDKTHDTNHVFHTLYPDIPESQQSIKQMAVFLKKKVLSV